MAKTEAKILRVGIIQGGKIIEERLLRRREAVSIGQSPKNTFYVPISKLPRSLTLFEVKGDQYFLSFTDATKGRVSFQDRVHAVAELKAHKSVTTKGGTHSLPLDEKSRGKIVLGDITILFQFVPPPPVVPKPQLPASAKGGIGQALMGESAFLLAILASLLVQGGFIAMSIVFETPPEKVKKQNRFVMALARDVEYQEEVEQKEEEEKKDGEKPDEEGDKAEEGEPDVPPTAEPPKEQAQKKPQKGQEGARSSKPLSTADLRKQRRAKVRNNTILKHITAMGGPGGTAGPDALRGGHAEKMADAFKTGGITVGKPGEVAGFEGGAKLEGEAARGARVMRLTHGERGTGRLKTAKVEKTAKKVEAEVKARIGLRSGTKVGGMGQLDGASVARVFRRRASAFRTCYEKRLKVNPNLSGKIVLTFTIGTEGRITNITVSSNSTGDSAVGSCIIDKVRGWRFQPPDKGAVTMRFPIVLSKG